MQKSRFSSVQIHQRNSLARRFVEHYIGHLGITMDHSVFNRIEHDLYGAVDAKLKTEFVRQQYLVHTRVAATDPPQFEYHWGPRANHEVSKKRVLQFVAKVCLYSTCIILSKC